MIVCPRGRDLVYHSYTLPALADVIYRKQCRIKCRYGSLSGVTCDHEGELVGYCFGDLASGEVVVLALLPAYEGKGIGRKLLDLVVTQLHAKGHQKLFLGCSGDPQSRSYGFYRHLGWRATGAIDQYGDEVLEYRF